MCKYYRPSYLQLHFRRKGCLNMRGVLRAFQLRLGWFFFYPFATRNVVCRAELARNVSSFFFFLAFFPLALACRRGHLCMQDTS